MLQSHTATQQWQSFEIRMRRRRVECCLLRASVALEAGVLEDVRTALEEVERLDPHEPTLHTLTAQLALAEARLSYTALETPAVVATAVAVPAGAPARVPLTIPDVPLVQASLPELSILQAVDRPRGGRAAAYAIAALLIAVSGAGGWFYVTGLPPAAQPMTRPRPAQQKADVGAAGAAPATAPAVRISETAVAAAPRLEPATAEAAVATAGPDRAAGSSAVGPEPPPAPPPTTIDAGKPTPLRTTEPPASPGSAANTTTGSPPPAVERPRDEPAPSLPDPPPVAPVAVAGADGVALTDTSVSLTPPPLVFPPAARTPPPPPSPAAAAPQNDDGLVRTVLGRYEAAYSALDAGAASRVWPTVDRRALASAFDGLRSQTVSLGRCDVRVSGATAQAECRGTARWNPKVGGGPQSASRQWHFELRNTGGDWIIVRATVR